MTSDGVRVGIDLVEVDRFAQALQKYPALLWRLFTPAERAACVGAGRLERLAARFAVKEAAFKALGEGWPQVGYRDVAVAGSPSGRPHLRLRGRAAALAGRSAAAVSISHSGGLAIGQVVLNEKGEQ